MDSLPKNLSRLCGLFEVVLPKQSFLRGIDTGVMTVARVAYYGNKTAAVEFDYPLIPNSDHWASLDRASLTGGHTKRTH